MVLIGTSGWSYNGWKERFYPQGLAQRKWLEHYSSRFDTVEINATFYRIPKAGTAEGWHSRTPPGFRFAVKVSRLITHVHKLRECSGIIEWFFREMAPLRDKTVAYLLQLPPSLCPSEDIFVEFLAQLPQGNRYVFELRNRAGYEGYIPRILQDCGYGFCLHDYPGRQTPILATSPLVYIRLHGYGVKYAGRYPARVLAEWAVRIRDWSAQGRDVLVYFNNDAEGHAIENALSLREMIAGTESTARTGGQFMP